MKKKISILGSTGSIGRQALEVIEKLEDKFEIIALAAGNNIELLNEQIRRFKPRYAFASNINLIEGAQPASLDEICSNKENDIILVAVSGRIGLKPTITAINNGIDITLANSSFFGYNYDVKILKFFRRILMNLRQYLLAYSLKSS